MPLPPPKFRIAHGVLQFAGPLQPNPARDEVFIATVQQEFPNVINRSFLPVDTPPTAPYMTLASTSSQLALSTVQADFEVRFYGEYLTDTERALEYVERKLGAVLRGLDAIGASVETVGLIGTLHFSLLEGEEKAALHVLRTHLRTTVDEASVQDALARVAVRVRDTYFVTLTLSNYELRVLEQPIMPGMQLVRMRPGQGRLDDEGLELQVDINNNLEVRAGGNSTRVTADGIAAVSRLLREIATTAGPAFAQTGSISVQDLSASSTV